MNARKHVWMANIGLFLALCAGAIAIVAQNAPPAPPQENAAPQAPPTDPQDPRYRLNVNVELVNVVATVLDEISCAAAVFLLDRFVVTGELVVRYHRPVPVEAPLELEAAIHSRAHARYVEVEARVRQDGALLARSLGKFFYQERPARP